MFAIIPGFFSPIRASTPLPKLLQALSDEREHSSTSDDDGDESYESSAPFSINLSQPQSEDSQNFEETPTSPAFTNTSVIVASWMILSIEPMKRF